jgi:hypothetical protein
MPIEGGPTNGYVKGWGSLASATSGEAVALAKAGDFNVSLTGPFVGTVVPERSFDGTTWMPFTYVDGTAITYSAPFTTILSEPERGVLWRIRCTSLTSGSVGWRISQ